MIQKHFHAENFGELKWNLAEIAELDEYQTAKTVLVQVYIECWDLNVIRKAISMVRARLSKATVIGMTNVNHEVYQSFSGDQDDDLRLGSIVMDLLCLERSSVEVVSYETDQMPELVAGGQMSLLLSEVEDVRGVYILSADVRTQVEDFLVMATAESADIPFFGTTASVGRNKEKGKGYIFHGEHVISRGIICVMLSGADLHVRTGYNFGWTPIGKKMTITKMEGEQLVCEIDDKPATHVYKKYLGLGQKQLIAENVCEFPFAVMHGERLVARIGFRTDDPGKMILSAPLFEGDHIQLSYGNPDIIFAESFADAMEVQRFQPQALYLIACMNRSILLKKDVEIERNFYAPAAPEKMVIHGNSEILMDEKGGGELNSALVSVALREGDAPLEQVAVSACNKNECVYRRQSTIPLVRRMTTFLEATTRDLEDAVEEAHKAIKARSQFLSSVSHEIRTPINAVLGMDEMILRESAESNIHHYAMDIQNAGRTLLSLINDLLDSSRIESGKLEIIPVEYELSSMLNDLVNMTAVRADEKNLELKVNVDSTIPHVLYGDDTRIKQCALNILTNAVKYTETGTVTMDVTAQKIDAEQIDLCVSVTDTGIGIKEEDIDKLFVPFTRIEEKRNRGIEGTGLGMNIVTALLSQMDSKLDVKSVYGEGSTFSFVIRQKVVNWEPIGDFTEMYRRSIETAEQYHESFHASDARLLVVDDTRMNLTVIRGLLKATRVQIDTAESGKEALSLVKKRVYDIIFLDQRMPGMDGIETLREMKRMYGNKNHDTPVIMLTANAVAGAREMFLEEGFDDYLTKPINGRKLEKTIYDYLPKDKLQAPEQTAEHSVGNSVTADAESGQYGGGFATAGAESGQQYSDGFTTADMEAGQYGNDFTMAGAASGANGSGFIKALSEIEGFSVKDGLTNCMNEEILQATIHDFIVAAKTGPDELQGYLDSDDIENYTIRVHALKSSARIIGANALSEQAKYLEACGDDNNRAEIDEKTPQLLADYRSMADALASAEGGSNAKVQNQSGSSQSGSSASSADNTTAVSKNTNTTTAKAIEKPQLPQEQLTSALQGVRELIEAFDFDGAADVLGMLRDYSLSEEASALTTAISDHITKLERDAVLEKLDGYGECL